jgi:hypothetical protein
LGEIILANYFNLFSFNRKVGTKHPSSNLSAVSAVAKMPSAMTREEIIVVDLDDNSAAQTLSFHLEFRVVVMLEREKEKC